MTDLDRKCPHGFYIGEYCDSCDKPNSRLPIETDEEAAELGAFVDQLRDFIRKGDDDCLDTADRDENIILAAGREGW